MKLQFPRTAKNWLSVIGSVIAVISFFMIVFISAISMFFGGGAYLGIIVYILLPGILIIGLLLIPIGMLRQRKRIAEEPPWPYVDLNKSTHRNAFFVFTIGTVIFLFMTAIGSYEAFQFTESVEFCGKVCHSVMKPEYTAYQHSPHARVPCVDCHVGEGADWYVRSKLSGLYQVYSVTFEKYPRPIPTPIHNLRPSREICEKCHWPQKFYAHQLRTEYHYQSDENNTRWQIKLNMKIGAEHQAEGLKEGIHWHINPDIKVQYYAADEAREELPWVRYINLETGDTLVYQDTMSDLDADTIPTAEIRTMECIDCHNRPSHQYQPPAFFVDEALTAGSIPKALPGIKALSMEICAEEYASMEIAMQAIDSTITAHYDANYPQIVRDNSRLIDQAVRGLQEAFGENIFPRMKVRWSAFPNHIGHMEFEGCFRCHDGQHVTTDDQPISRDCNLCHNINAQGTDDNLQMATLDNPLEFEHPVDIGGAWEMMLCTECHTGLSP
ncbi:MAG: cytochrome C [candidate division Zixibacteria bacterium]|nr:cytochrome C [candidate division Zixibacteria bacterium]